jgi:hypothetical protein
MKKIIILIIVYMFSVNVFAASSIYMTYVNRKHFIKINEATGDDSVIKNKKRCEEWIKERGEEYDRCILINKTDYGGYGSIAIGKKSQGYAQANDTQARSDKNAMEQCLIKSPKCEVVTRWKDEGKVIMMRVHKTYGWDPFMGYYTNQSPDWED